MGRTPCCRVGLGGIQVEGGGRVKAGTARESTLHRVSEWIRHHVSSLVGTGVDFATMIAAVELLGLSPVAGTVLGATVGGVINFWLGRHFTFRSKSNQVSRQFLRYGLVSAASLGLNALGEHIFISFVAARYVLGRILVASTVNNAWNYPMQRFFVFAERKPAGDNPA
jgi:putative flippase GtrA